MTWRGFASDNYAGVHPEVLDAIVRANAGHAVAYGDDDETSRLGELVRDHFGAHAEVFPVFNGTGANVVALQAICRPWESVICADTAHVNVDEGGAPEKVGRLKLWTTPTEDGLLTPEAIEAMLKRELRRKAGQQLAESAAALGAVDLPPLTEDEIQAEIDAYRAERRARRP